MTPVRLGILVSHPVQYFTPWFRALARRCDLKVFYAHDPSPEEQGKAGFGVSFQWDVPLLGGYPHQFLKNNSPHPSADRFMGCICPEIDPIIQNGHFDGFILTGWYLYCHWQAFWSCRRSRTSVLVRGDSQLGTRRSLLRRTAGELFYRWFIPKFDGYLVVGRRFREYLLHYGADPKRMFDVPHFVDNEFFRKRADDPALKDKLDLIRRDAGVKAGDVLFLFCGKLIPRKRPMDFLAALEKAADPHLAAIFVGDGPLRGDLEYRVNSGGLRVLFAGFKNQKELPAYYAACDSLVLPSDPRETWGLVVNEAMACGKPSIVSTAAGCSEDLIEDGVTGFRFPAEDVAALADRMRQFARMIREGHDFKSRVAAKIAGFDVELAAARTIDAVREVRSHA